MAGKIRHIILVLLIINSFGLLAQNGQKQKVTLDYIEKYKKIAMCEMIKDKIPASITLAQGILESGNGTSRLATEGNNHFGIKCHNDWNGKTMRHDDDAPKECFRVYKTPEESFRDHSIFLKNNTRYAALFDLKITDYKGWAKGLKKAGYATLPTYANVLINLIETYDLQKYDQMVVSGKFKCKKKEIKKEEPKTDEPQPEKPKKEKAKKEKVKKPKVKSIKPNAVLAVAPVFAECPVVGMTPDHHYIRENFGVKFVLTKEGDELATLAKELRIAEYQLVKYNDLGSKKTFTEGEVLYIGPKRRKAPQGYDYHKIQQGETLRYVSRLYAIKLERLFKMNGLYENSVLSVGQEIRLR
ncbi:MAG: glucosaminidase domain-containing protein [Bacteroidales bacterium]|nr:glucosaminidase domain-containing protein [Bacteroidales bacterium]